MMSSTDEEFTKFLNFCQQNLTGTNKPLISLIKKRYNECGEKYRSSRDLRHLLSSTRKKMASDSKHLFVHLKDCLNELKAYGSAKAEKRKRAEYDSDDNVWKKSKWTNGNIRDNEKTNTGAKCRSLTSSPVVIDEDSDKEAVQSEQTRKPLDKKLGDKLKITLDVASRKLQTSHLASIIQNLKEKKAEGDCESDSSPDKTSIHSMGDCSRNGIPFGSAGGSGPDKSTSGSLGSNGSDDMAAGPTAGCVLSETSPSSSGDPVLDKQATSLRDSGLDKQATSSRDSGLDTLGTSSKDSGLDKPDNSLRDSGLDNPGTSLRDSGLDNPGTSLRDSGLDKPGTSLKDSGLDITDTTLNDSGLDKPGTTSKDSGLDKPGTTSKDSGLDKPGTTSKDSGLDKPVSNSLEDSVPDKPESTCTRQSSLAKPTATSPRESGLDKTSSSSDSIPTADASDVIALDNEAEDDDCIVIEDSPPCQDPNDEKPASKHFSKSKAATTHRLSLSKPGSSKAAELTPVSLTNCDMKVKCEASDIDIDKKETENSSLSSSPDEPVEIDPVVNHSHSADVKQCPLANNDHVAISNTFNDDIKVETSNKELESHKISSVTSNRQKVTSANLGDDKKGIACNNSTCAKAENSEDTIIIDSEVTLPIVQISSVVSASPLKEENDKSNLSLVSSSDIEITSSRVKGPVFNIDVKFDSEASTTVTDMKVGESSVPSPSCSTSGQDDLTTATKSPRSPRSPASTDDHEEKKDRKKKEVSAKHIHRLEKLLEKLRDKIDRLQEKELTLDDLDEEDSNYIYEDKLKKKFVAVWNKLCELKERTPTTGRPTERRFTYQGTRYPEVNKKIEKMINKKKIFPDFHDIKRLVGKVNISDKLHLSNSAVDSISREAFTDVGNMLQQRRREDFVTTFGCKMTDSIDPGRDPAMFDVELRQKLEENKTQGKANLEEVIRKYSDMQHAHGELPEEVPDGSDAEKSDEEKSDDDDPEVVAVTIEDLASDNEDVVLVEPPSKKLQEESKSRSATPSPPPPVVSACLSPVISSPATPESTVDSPKVIQPRSPNKPPCVSPLAARKSTSPNPESPQTIQPRYAARSSSPSPIEIDEDSLVVSDSDDEELTSDCTFVSSFETSDCYPLTSTVKKQSKISPSFEGSKSGASFVNSKGVSSASVVKLGANTTRLEVNRNYAWSSTGTSSNGVKRLRLSGPLSPRAASTMSSSPMASPSKVVSPVKPFSMNKQLSSPLSRTQIQQNRPSGNQISNHNRLSLHKSTPVSPHKQAVNRFISYPDTVKRVNSGTARQTLQMHGSMMQQTRGGSRQIPQIQGRASIQTHGDAVRQTSLTHNRMSQIRGGVTRPMQQSHNRVPYQGSRDGVTRQMHQTHNRVSQQTHNRVSQQMLQSGVSRQLLQTHNRMQQQTHRGVSRPILQTHNKVSQLTPQRQHGVSRQQQQTAGMPGGVSRSISQTHSRMLQQTQVQHTVGARQTPKTVRDKKMSPLKQAMQMSSQCYIDIDDSAEEGGACKEGERTEGEVGDQSGKRKGGMVDEGQDVVVLSDSD